MRDWRTFLKETLGITLLVPFGVRVTLPAAQEPTAAPQT